MKNFLLDNWMPLIASALTAFCILHVQKPTAHVKHPHPMIAPLTVAEVPTPAAESAAPNGYTYTFSGLAMANGQPMANTALEIRITTEVSADVHHTMTDVGGHFSLPVSFAGEPNQTLSWEIRGVTADLKQVTLEGHQILTDNHIVQMAVPTELAEI